MIPVHKLLLKFSRDKYVNKEELEIAVEGRHGEPLEYYYFEDIIVDKDNQNTFTFIDENDSFIKIPYDKIKKVLINEKPVWEKE